MRVTGYQSCELDDNIFSVTSHCLTFSHQETTNGQKNQNSKTLSEKINVIQINSFVFFMQTHLLMQKHQTTEIVNVNCSLILPSIDKRYSLAIAAFNG